MTTFTAANAENYERYEEFLPPFPIVAEAVTSKLASVCDYDTLRCIITMALYDVGINECNKAFATRIKNECDDYGYEKWEDPIEIFVEQFYATIELLVDEIQEYTEFMGICKLHVKLA